MLYRGGPVATVSSPSGFHRAARVRDNGDGTSTLQTSNFGTDKNLCVGERFRDQPVGAFCSGFLVGPDIIATAGHCVNADNVTNVRFVFGFRMRNATTAETIIRNEEIYRGVALLGRAYDPRSERGQIGLLFKSIVAFLTTVLCGSGELER
jgi:hypothetical protein